MVFVRGEMRNPADPEPGFYAVRLVKKGIEVAAKIEVDGGGDCIWAVQINGVGAGVTNDPALCDPLQQVWLFGRKIDEVEYNYLLARYQHYKAHEPDSPYANPEKPVDRRLMPPMGA